MTAAGKASVGIKPIGGRKMIFKRFVTAAAAVAISLFAAAAVTADDNVPVKDDEGYYNIYNSAQLYWYAQKYNNAEFNTEASLDGENDLKIRLMRDIIINDGTMSAESTDVIPWEPIGGSGQTKSPYWFNGIFDGQGHYISGIYCNDANMAGLFAINKGTIKNLGIIHSYFYSPTFTWSDAYAGTFAGQNKENGVIENCYCYNNIVRSEYVAGGIAGRLSDKSYAACAIRNCYTSNDVLGAKASKARTDAIACRYNGLDTSTTAVIENTYYDGSKQKSYNTEPKAFTSTQLESGELTYLLNNKKSTSSVVWRQNVTVGERDFLPVLDSGHYIVYKEDGEYKNHEEDAQDSDDPLSLVPNSSGVYEIRNENQLYAFARLINEYYEDHKDADAILKADLVINVEELKEQNFGAKPWTPIGTTKTPYLGKFDGDMHTISGIYGDDAVSEKDYEGLFGCIGDDAIIKNLGIMNSYFYATTSSGAVTAICQGGTIQDCFSRNNVIKSEYDVGGIVGETTKASLLKNCFCADCTIFSSKTDEGGSANGISGVFNEKFHALDQTNSSAENCFYYRLSEQSEINRTWNGIHEGQKGDCDLNCVVDILDVIKSEQIVGETVGMFDFDHYMADIDGDDYISDMDVLETLVIAADLVGKI